MRFHQAPSVELGNAPETHSVGASPSPSEVSSTSSPEPQNIRAPPLFRVLAMPPPDPVQPPGQEELERRLPGYRRIVIPRELTLIELLKQSSGVTTDDEVLQIREAKLRVVAERVGLRRLHVLAPRLRALTLDGSAIASLRDLGIGLVHLKFLSVNRCNLSSLDGIWGLTNLRELHASSNRIQDLNPLGPLQKLYTLDLSDNPIAESSRLWTLGICSALRRLTLRGTPAADAADYRGRVASTLPDLCYLDDRPMHNDIDYDLDDVAQEDGSSSESEHGANTPRRRPEEPKPGPSTPVDHTELPPDVGPLDVQTASASADRDPARRRRPATTEAAGPRPDRPRLPPRPHTAQAKDRRARPPTRLEVMNTLMDEEWRCSGSSLTSHGAVCGNLAQALRRPSTAHQSPRWTDLTEDEKESSESTMEVAARALAAEIPVVPRFEDWDKFRKDTGIEIDIDFSERPKAIDPKEAMDRLEAIERETIERAKNGHADGGSTSELRAYLATIAKVESSVSVNAVDQSAHAIDDVLAYDLDMWRGIEDLAPTADPYGDVDVIYDDAATSISTNSRRAPFSRSRTQPDT